MRSGTSLTFALVALTSCLGGDGTHEQLSSVSQGARVRGAIFTTLPDGSAVNHNIYAAKTDVYLDGGPQGGSPSGAAALAEGDYYFQVTDPSGHVLLSSDAIECRRIHVNDEGVISAVVGTCQHATSLDQDYASLGALTVQLMPYADTPNPGGEYKVWATPVAAYTGSGPFHGFVPSFSKTDNFKVRPIVVSPPDDDEPCCGDGHVDSGEQCDDGNTTSGDGCSSTCTTELPPPDNECPYCGDGRLDSLEQCDDGNTIDGDGCSSTCTIETSSCCGNGTIDAGEECDDDNLINGDGCSAVCTLEPCDGEDCGGGGGDDGGGGGGYPPPELDDGALCDSCVSTVQTNPETVFVQ
jgi:cysteine-rich repeat protein